MSRNYNKFIMLNLAINLVQIKQEHCATKKRSFPLTIRYRPICTEFTQKKKRSMTKLYNINWLIKVKQSAESFGNK